MPSCGFNRIFAMRKKYIFIHTRFSPTYIKITINVQLYIYALQVIYALNYFL